MARPKGSTNKPKVTGNNLSVLRFEKQIENAAVTRNSGQGWVNYGLKNDYPLQLINLYNTSVTQRACVDFSVNAILGEGIDYEASNLNGSDLPTPNYQMSWDDFIRAISFDFILYGAFAFQVIRNKGGETYSFYPQPIETVRLEEMDSEGVINNAYLSADWTATGKYPPVPIPMFGFQEEEKIDYGKTYLYYYKPYNPVNAYYGLPVYASAINCIQAESAYQIWDLKNITNGFTAAGAITLPSPDTEEERNATVREITKLFTGAENSNAFMVTFSNSIDDKPVTYTPFTTNYGNINMYDSANERVVNRIVAAHKITSKSLIGFPTDNTGFSDSGAYLEAAYSLYNISVANNNRRQVLNAVNNAFKLNGVDVQLQLKPLRYKADEQQTTVSTNENTDAQTTNEDNAIEREDNTL